MTDLRANIRERLETAVVDDPATGAFRCLRDVFTDPALFDLEMKHIFEGNWVYLAHESQIPENNDYFTTFIGRQPIIITRDKTGQLNAVINACAHRGAMLCRKKHGNKGSFTCQAPDGICAPSSTIDDRALAMISGDAGDVMDAG